MEEERTFIYDIQTDFFFFPNVVLLFIFRHHDEFNEFKRNTRARGMNDAYTLRQGDGGRAAN